MMFLHEDSGNRQCDYQESMMMQAYFEIIQHVVNMNEVPENVCHMRAFLGPGDHVKCVELYSTVRTLTFENFGLEFVWSTTQE